MIIYALLLCCIAYFVMNYVPTPGTGIEFVMLYGFVLIVQSVRVLVQYKRSDHYGQRLGAIGVILSTPFFGILAISFVSTPWDPLAMLLCAFGVSGLIWLSWRLTRKDKTIRLSAREIEKANQIKPTLTPEEVEAQAAKQKQTFQIVRVFTIIFILLALLHFYMWMNGSSIHAQDWSWEFPNIFSGLSIPAAIACIIVYIRLRG
jgi:hypothetical protein